jgi:hypothetical protein
MVMIVHAGVAAVDLRDALREFSEGFRGLGRRRLERSAVARIHARAEHEPRRPRRLLGDDGAPLRALGTPRPSERPALVLGRVIPTTTAYSRSMARLAQRVLQEEHDARLTVFGDIALFAVEVPIGRRDPAGATSRAIASLGSLARTRHQTQRLFQAARLWLGARMVWASMSGEDWTALVSESIDLCRTDAEIAAALSRDARTMLAAEPDALMAWQKRWLDPRKGEPGWDWVVVGADKPTLAALERLTPVVRQRL